MRNVLITLFLAAPLFAQHPPYLSPNSGSVLGGDVITIGRLTIPADATPEVRFGASPALSVTRVDDATLRITTPPAANLTEQNVPVQIFVSGEWIQIINGFFYEERPPNAWERVLVPVFAPPVAGQHGSEFVSLLRVMNTSHDRTIDTFGLVSPCLMLCPEITMRAYGLNPRETDTPAPTGAPGAFVFIRPEDANDFVMQLRAYDTSRSATNFGTEIPIVRADEFRTDPVILLGVPTDSRFRNTLRIYARYHFEFDVVIENDSTRVQRRVQLQEGEEPFIPAYVEVSDFPIEVGPVRVTVTYVDPVLVDPPPEPQPFWAFVSVTNNDTQHITVISPQR